jgi:hypothetical protein
MITWFSLTVLAVAGSGPGHGTGMTRPGIFTTNDWRLTVAGQLPAPFPPSQGFIMLVLKQGD